MKLEVLGIGCAKRTMIESTQNAMNIIANKAEDIQVVTQYGSRSTLAISEEIAGVL